MEEREEQFYFKLDQEIYKVQGILKLKLAAIDSERLSALRKIETIVRGTYHGMSHFN